MTVTPSRWAVLAASAVVVLFSFFNFMELADADRDELREGCALIGPYGAGVGEDAAQIRVACSMADDGGFSAWNTDWFFPLATWPALCALFVLALTAVGTFTDASTPRSWFGFSTPQFLFGLSLVGALVMVGFLISGGDETLGWGTGFYLMLVGALALVVASAVEMVGAHRTIST